MPLPPSEAPVPKPTVVEQGLNRQQVTTSNEARRVPSAEAQRMARYVDQQLLSGTNPDLIIRSIAESAQIRPEQRVKFAAMNEQQRAEEILRQDMRERIRKEQARFIANEVVTNERFQRIDGGVMANALAGILDTIEQNGWDTLVTKQPDRAEQFMNMPEIRDALDRKQKREEARRAKQMT